MQWVSTVTFMIIFVQKQLAALVKLQINLNLPVQGVSVFVFQVCSLDHSFSKTFMLQNNWVDLFLSRLHVNISIHQGSTTKISHPMWPCNYASECYPLEYMLEYVYQGAHSGTKLKKIIKKLIFYYIFFSLYTKRLSMRHCVAHGLWQWQYSGSGRLFFP